MKCQKRCEGPWFFNDFFLEGFLLCCLSGGLGEWRSRWDLTSGLRGWGKSSASPGTLKMPESPPFSAPCFRTHTLVLAPIPPLKQKKEDQHKGKLHYRASDITKYQLSGYDRSPWSLAIESYICLVVQSSHWNPLIRSKINTYCIIMPWLMHTLSMFRHFVISLLLF